MAVKERATAPFFYLFYEERSNAMNYICPLCNALEQTSLSCEKCNNSLHDLGKVVDYLDDYSPYEEIVTLKLVDGLENSVKRHQCLHLFRCSHCGYDKRITVQEKPLI